MNVGIDLDFTITELPEFFRILTGALRDAGHKVYVVSFRDNEGLEASAGEAREHGVSFDGLFHPEDDEGLSEFKARMARELAIDIFIDDMPEAFLDMPSGVERFWLCDPSLYDMRRMVAASEGLSPSEPANPLDEISDGFEPQPENPLDDITDEFFD